MIQHIVQHGLERIQLIPSRKNILDQSFGTYPSVVKSCKTVPSMPANDVVVVDSDVKPRYNKQKHRKLYISTAWPTNQTGTFELCKCHREQII